jgi:hypothetical protein
LKVHTPVGVALRRALLGIVFWLDNLRNTCSTLIQRGLSITVFILIRVASQLHRILERDRTKVVQKVLGKVDLRYRRCRAGLPRFWDAPAPITVGDILGCRSCQRHEEN